MPPPQPPAAAHPPLDVKSVRPSAWTVHPLLTACECTELIARAEALGMEVCLPGSQAHSLTLSLSLSLSLSL